MAMEPLTMSLQGMGIGNTVATEQSGLNSSSIGPQKWSNSTIKTVKLSQSIVDRSDRAIDIGKATDPLPTIREVVAELSNNEIKRYTREVRSSVVLFMSFSFDSNYYYYLLLLLLLYSLFIIIIIIAANNIIILLVLLLLIININCYRH